MNTLNRNKRTPLLIAEGYRPGNFAASDRGGDHQGHAFPRRQAPTGPKPKHTRNLALGRESPVAGCNPNCELKILYENDSPGGSLGQAPGFTLIELLVVRDHRDSGRPASAGVGPC